MNQNLVALESANRFRLAAAQYRADVQAGKIDRTTAIEQCQVRVRVGLLLRAHPGIGKTKADRICHKLNLSPETFVYHDDPHACLTAHQRTELQAIVNGNRFARELEREKRKVRAAARNEKVLAYWRDGLTLTDIATACHCDRTTAAKWRDRAIEAEAA